MTHRIFVFGLMATVLLVFGCKKDNDTQQENITKVIVHLIGSGGFDQEFVWNDPDGGDVGNAIVDDIVIPAGITGITCHLHIIDGTKSPQQELTQQIESESNVHLFVYKLSGTAVAGIAYDDVDSNGKNFGLDTKWTAGTGTGTVNIVLHHQPTNKDDLVNPGGEVDFDVTFPVRVP